MDNAEDQKLASGAPGAAPGGAPASASPAEPTHTPDGAPTDAAHRAVGDGSLLGAVPAGLSPDELRELAENPGSQEPGTS